MGAAISVTGIPLRDRDSIVASRVLPDGALGSSFRFRSFSRVVTLIATLHRLSAAISDQDIKVAANKTTTSNDGERIPEFLQHLNDAAS